MPEERGHFQGDRVIDVLRLFGTLRGLSAKKAEDQGHAYLDDMGMGDQAFKKIQSLSNGQQQKIHLGITFMGTPDLLVLDEPTRGFDPVNKAIFNEYVAERTNQGATLILITHQMQEVEDLTERVLFLNEGVQHYFGKVIDSKRDLGETRSEFTYAGELPEAVRDWPIYHPENGRGVLTHEIHTEASPEVLLSQLISSGTRVTGFQTRSSTLDEVFLQVYGEPTRITTVA